jgi:enamine deaminase RidA (YjgF/YER057c/UK114 family)
MDTIDNVKGSYRFLPGIEPFSSGVVAMPRFQVVHATLRYPMPWRKGFELIDRQLRAEGRPRAALCAVELRIPAPLTFDGFDAFNHGYRMLLESWHLIVDGQNPIARTNVAPVVGAPDEPSLYGFAYTAPGGPDTPTFVVAGSGETRTREKSVNGLVRGGETTPEAIREKAAYVLDVMHERLHALGADWTDVTAINIYTAHPIEPFLETTILDHVGLAAIHGVTWHLSHPPVVDIEFEMDLRGVARRVWVSS